MNIQPNKYNIQRHDLSGDKSLRPWNASDELILQTFNALDKKPNNLAVYNDRFGFLACQLHELSPTIVITHKSQEKAIDSNREVNDIPALKLTDPLSEFESKADFVLLKIPKSLGLFQLFLEQLSNNSTEDVTVICGFMTRHFTPNMLAIAQEYFEEVEQSKAVKKARVLVLTKKKKVDKKELITSLTYNKDVYKQYLGVFSAEHIDYATQFFLEHIDINNKEERILDLASGNGILGKEISKKLPEAEIHLMDDSNLAVSSAELNIQGKNIYHHFNNELSLFNADFFDLIVTNPPFHFEYEININVAIELFKACYRCLKVGGNLQVVSSTHLNYKTHLEPIFTSVQIIAEDKKFSVYKCVK